MNTLLSTSPDVSSLNGPWKTLQRRPLLSFYLIAFVLSWLAWLPYVLSKQGLGILPFHLPEAFLLLGLYLGPIFSSFLMTAITAGKPGVRDLLHRFVLWRVHWKWYLFTLIAVPLVQVVGAIILMLLFTGNLSALKPLALQYYPFALLFQIVVSGLGEEPGWRGFALPRWQQRYGPVWGTLILGILWGCWHLPLFLTDWADPGTNLLTVGAVILETVCVSFLITWVLNYTGGSILMAILLHSGVDAFASQSWSSLFPTPQLLHGANLALDISYGALAVLLIILTRGSLGYKGARRRSGSEVSDPQKNP